MRPLTVRLRAMADLLTGRAAEILAANAADVADGEADGLGRGLIDRLQLDETRIADMARQIGCSPTPASRPRAPPSGSFPGGLRLAERRVPVGVIARTSRPGRMSPSTSPRSC